MPPVPADDRCDREGAGGSREPQPSGWLIHYSKLQLSFKGLKMPLSRAVLNTNTFIVMDVAAEASWNLQVQSDTAESPAFDLGLRTKYVK